ncbi:hypothetical protein [Mucilaginibacter aquatilis]|uniref:Uncharacterized protein n=1 Tax=Mucilaginibacter aquatilis TaxID=1517760 RepID=A0A6I4I6G7_9SPHI|nr:hypothetical protein [Mucilaginibacter aquatilis]MVN90795.1 hypothetical protein [Mucilaginibacter aquatilis]
MLKNWLHIILSVWLINSVTFLHSGNPADSFIHGHIADNGEESYVNVNSWADCLIESVTNDDDSPAQKAHKIKYQRRYVRNRSANDRVFVPTTAFYLPFETVRITVLHAVNKSFIGMAKLPAYYNFLFRLSPF